MGFVNEGKKRILQKRVRFGRMEERHRKFAKSFAVLLFLCKKQASFTANRIKGNISREISGNSLPSGRSRKE